MDLQDMLHYICYVLNDYESIHRRRSEDVFAAGTAVTQIAWDEDMANGKGDIALIRWPLESFLWDPTAEDIQDARAVFKLSWHPMSWFEAHYPEEAKYVNADSVTRKRVGMPESQRDMVQTDEDRAMLMEYWYRTYEHGKYYINVALAAGGALLEHKKHVYKHGMYPFVIDVHSTVEGSLAGDGLVMELAPMQRYINRYARYIDVNLRKSSKGRMLVRKNSGINRKDLADYDADLIEGDSIVQGEDWAWIQHEPLNSMITQQMLQMQTDLKQDSGANQFTRGETTGGVVSGKAIQALQEGGSKITNLRIETLSIGFKKICEQILWLIAQYYDDKRMTYITGRDGRAREVQVNPDIYFKGRDGKVGAPPYLVQIEVQRRDPVAVESQNQMFLQTYTMAAQAQQFFPLSSLIRILNFDGKDRILPIVEQNETFMQQMQSLQQQNMQMTEQMQQLQQDNDNLKATTMQMANTMANIGAISGQSGAPAGSKVAAAGGGRDTTAAMVDGVRAGLDNGGAINYLE